MSEYGIREEKRQALEDWVEERLQEEGLSHIFVARKRGRGRSKIVDSEIDSDELEVLGSGPAVVDRVLEMVDRFSGRMELTARYADYNEKDGKGDVNKAFQLVRAREPSTKSQVASHATEQLATSLASAFDVQSQRAEAREERFGAVLGQMIERSDESAERRLSEHTQYQIEVMRLRDELARKDLEMALVEANQGFPPEVWIELFKAGMPIVGEFAGALTVAVKAWGSTMPPLAAPAAPAETPTPAAAAEAPGAQ